MLETESEITVDVEEINHKHQVVCDATLEGKDRRDAGLIAGFEDTPNIRQVVCRVLARPECKAYIREIQEERARVNVRTATLLLDRLVEFANADIVDIIDEDTNTLKPVHQWPPIMRKMVRGVTITELFKGYGKEREIIGQTVNIKTVDPVKILQLIGEHIDVGAYRKQVEHTHSHYINLEEKLRAGRTRAFADKPPGNVIDNPPSGGKDFNTGEVIKTVSVSGKESENLALESGGKKNSVPRGTE